MVFAVAGLVVGAGAVGLAWGVSGPGDDESFTLVGQARISTSDPTKSGPCNGAKDLDDVDKDALVTVRDSAGRVVATGALGQGEYHDSACRFPIVLPDVPGGSDSYSVQVLWHPRKKVTSEEARAGSLVIDLK
ncbi:hypothetical protein ACIQWA_32925 [Kitasatospora sp. NPDC098652]|uniref:hypothetical protein n=1 Tax=Kitasatospora sp. NPDC098652 TaxID=3364095 RepID=UPI00381F2BF7